MKNKKLLSIGDVSKIKGVHIKSLRYYDEIGILKPAYVDPSSNYRYYTISQLWIVDAIQLCVELDIPLKNFSMFITKNNQEILYAKLLEYGTTLAKQKINSIQEKLKYIEETQIEIKRSEACRLNNQALEFDMPEKICWTVSYDKEREDKDYNILLNKSLLEITKNNLKIGYEMGLLYIYKEKIEKFLFIDIFNKPQKSFSNIIYIPAGKYLCKATNKSSIQLANEQFTELFKKDYNKIVIETELFTGNYNVLNPNFELRCSLP